jgi:hypothetical protein
MSACDRCIRREGQPESVDQDLLSGLGHPKPVTQVLVSEWPATS